MSHTLSLALGRAQDLVESQALVNALTVDVEEYFHSANFGRRVPRSQWERMESRALDSTLALLDLLGEAGVRATFFVLGWLAERQPDLVRHIQCEGHEIGSLGYGHRPPHGPEEFRQDLRRSRKVLEDIVARPITFYRAPGFWIRRQTLWALDVLIEEGFALDASIHPVLHCSGAPEEPHRIEREGGHIWEFPPPVLRVFGWPIPVGGGCSLRLLPYVLTRRALQEINASGRPFACHVRLWELDPDQPRLGSNWLGNLCHYVNLHSTADRLRCLLQDFAFATLSQAMDRLSGESLLPTHSFGRAA